MSAPAIRRGLAGERGVTLSEMLVVLVVLGIVLTGMTTLFVSAARSHDDQSNRVEAQHNARLALDALRREIRCASAVAVNSASSLTITLPGYCQKPAAASAAAFTWCAAGASAPYALWRYEGSACSGTGLKKAELLASNTIFTYNRATPGPVQAAPIPGASVANGYFKPGTYAYDVTAVLTGGVEVSGSIKSVTIPSGSPNEIGLSWSSYPGAVSYNVYGRDDGTNTAEGLRRLATVPGGTTSYTDLGCAVPSDTCTPAVVVTSAMASPPLATVGILLALDVTTGDARQRFTLTDDIVLRNSGRY
jgi:prepilin-type N-terminal cleavage/methylation domain-containing protein